MSGWIPLVLMAGLNLWTAVGFFRNDNIPLSIVFTCYAVSCLAFAWTALHGAANG